MVLSDGYIGFLLGKRLGVLDSVGAGMVGGATIGKEGEGLKKRGLRSAGFADS